MCRAAQIALLLAWWGSFVFGEEFYVLQGIDKTQQDSVLTAPGVNGFTIRVSWSKLQQDGFSWLDDQIARGDELNTQIQLRVMAGSHAPDNLPGVSYFDYLSTNSDGVVEPRRAPVPWDAAMHQHWQALTAQLGARYSDNNRIKVAHVPSFANSSEMHMPEEVTMLPGYSSPALSASWAAMAEPLAAALPQAVISLNYATPSQSEIDGDDSQWLLNEIAALAGGRAGYQANDFGADVDLDRNKYQTLTAQQELGRSIGFQMVSSSESQRFGGEFLEAVAIAYEAGAQWLEIYAADAERIPPPGDYNLNGLVDAADFTVWRDTRGTSQPFADGNRDDIVDVADYLFWKTHFGAVAGAVSLTASDPSSGMTAVLPEPATWLLVVSGAALFGQHRKRMTWQMSQATGPVTRSTVLYKKDAKCKSLSGMNEWNEWQDESYPDLPTERTSRWPTKQFKSE